MRVIRESEGTIAAAHQEHRAVVWPRKIVRGGRVQNFKRRAARGFDLLGFSERVTQAPLGRELVLNRFTGIQRARRQPSLPTGISCTDKDVSNRGTNYRTECSPTPTGILCSGPEFAHLTFLYSRVGYRTFEQVLLGPWDACRRQHMEPLYHCRRPAIKLRY